MPWGVQPREGGGCPPARAQGGRGPPGNTLEFGLIGAYLAAARPPRSCMPALAIWTPEDGVLGALAPLGLAASAGTALVIDLDPLGPRYPGEPSLADLVRE